MASKNHEIEPGDSSSVVHLNEVTGYYGKLVIKPFLTDVICET